MGHLHGEKGVEQPNDCHFILTGPDWLQCFRAGKTWNSSADKVNFAPKFNCATSSRGSFIIYLPLGRYRCRMDFCGPALTLPGTTGTLSYYLASNDLISDTADSEALRQRVRADVTAIDNPNQVDLYTVSYAFQEDGSMLTVLSAVSQDGNGRITQVRLVP